MAIDTLTSSLTISCQWTAQKDLTGTDYSPTTNSSGFNKKTTLGTSANSNTTGGADELISFVGTIANSGNTTIDLTNTTDILSQANTNLARVKALVIRLLSTDDDATNGTACTYITLDGSVSNAFLSGSGGRGWLAANTSTMDIPNGGAVGVEFASNTGVLVNSTIKNIKIINGDSGHPAAYQITVIGGSL